MFGPVFCRRFEFKQTMGKFAKGKIEFSIEEKKMRVLAFLLNNIPLKTTLEEGVLTIEERYFSLEELTKIIYFIENNGILKSIDITCVNADNYFHITKETIKEKRRGNLLETQTIDEFLYDLESEEKVIIGYDFPDEHIDKLEKAINRKSNIPMRIKDELISLLEKNSLTFLGKSNAWIIPSEIGLFAYVYKYETEQIKEEKWEVEEEHIPELYRGIIYPNEKREITYKGKFYPLYPPFMKETLGEKSIKMPNGILMDPCSVCVNRVKKITNGECAPCNPLPKK